VNFDELILPAVEAAVAESRRRAGEWIACRAGCAGCCNAAFAITALDASRLRAGLRGHPHEEAIRARAAAYAAAVRDTFPGEWAAGRLTDDEAWRDWFFARMKGRMACPALDVARGECELYEHRPVACRLHGHLIQIGAAAETSRCALCFVGATAAEMAACRVRVEECEVPGLEESHTIVALALSASDMLESSIWHCE